MMMFYARFTNWFIYNLEVMNEHLKWMELVAFYRNSILPNKLPNCNGECVTRKCNVGL